MKRFGEPLRDATSEVLETDRLLLRQFTSTDADDYAAMCADSSVMKHMSATGEPMPREAAWRQLAMLVGHWRLRGYGMWAIEQRSSGEFVGRVGLHYPEGWPDREVGWVLARRFWGRGMATEGARAVVSHAFQRLGWSHVISLIRPQNERSIRVAERLGARRTDRCRIANLDHYVYRLDSEST